MILKETITFLAIIEHGRYIAFDIYKIRWEL